MLMKPAVFFKTADWLWVLTHKMWISRFYFSDKGGFFQTFCKQTRRRFMTVVRLTSPITTTTTTADKLITRWDSANKKQILIFGGNTMTQFRTLGILFSIFYSCLNPFFFFFSLATLVKVWVRLTCSRPPASSEHPPLGPSGSSHLAWSYTADALFMTKSEHYTFWSHYNGPC